VANAEAGTSKVNLTASITAQINPTGVSGTTLYLSPHTGNQIGLYDGAAWACLSSAEVSVALGTLTSGLPYDVFAYNNSGTLTLELLAWTSDTARATALVRQDGIWCKTGALTRRWVGTIRTNSTTTSIDTAGGIITQVGGKRFVYNTANQERRYFMVKDTTASWTWATGSWRLINGATQPTNCCEVLCGDPLGRDAVRAEYWAGVNLQTNSARNAAVSIGVGSSNPALLALGQQGFNQSTTALQVVSLAASLDAYLGVGYHYIAPLEWGADGTSNFRGSAADGSNVNGMNGWCMG
jgi:hypothetical protein